MKCITLNWQGKIPDAAQDTDPLITSCDTSMGWMFKHTVTERHYAVYGTSNNGTNPNERRIG